MATRSNFGPKALQESKMRDREATKREKERIYGKTGINWNSLSMPVMSAVTPDNHVIIRQWGEGSEPLGYRPDKTTGEPVPYYEHIGVESVMKYDPETGVLSESGQMPQVVRFRASQVPKSWDEDFTSKQMPKFLQDWAFMIKGRDKDLPPITRVPQFKGNHEDYDDAWQKHMDEELAIRNTSSKPIPLTKISGAKKEPEIRIIKHSTPKSPEEGPSYQEEYAPIGEQANIKKTQDEGKGSGKKVTVKVKKSTVHPEKAAEQNSQGGQDENPKVTAAIQALIDLGFSEQQARATVLKNAEANGVVVSDADLKDIKGYKSNCKRLIDFMKQHDTTQNIADVISRGF